MKQQGARRSKKEQEARPGRATRTWCRRMQGNNHYYENQQGKGFVEKTRKYFPRTPWGAMGIKFFDFNQDGLMDLFITDMHSDREQQIDALKILSFTPMFLKFPLRLDFVAPPT